MPDATSDHPRRGRHRRYRPSTVSRASLTVTAGGAGLALPLVAGAAPPAGAADAVHSPATSHRPQPAPAATDDERQPHGGTTAARPQGGRADASGKAQRYEVAAGDTLSGIAAEQRVRGGWPALYERNRRTVGDDPDLIIPGQRLVLRGSKAAPAPPRTSPGTKDGPEKTDRAGKPKQTEKNEKNEKDKGDKAGGKANTKAKKSKTAKGGDRARKATQDKGGQAAKAKRAAPKPKPRPNASAGWTAPLAGAGVGTPYGARGSSWSSGYHTGVDFPVAVGTGVRAVTGGEVVSAGWGGAYGYEVVIRHKDGRYSQYAHLSAITVRAGQPVNAGQRIGRSGSTGNTTGPHLHFEVRTGPGYGSDVDPLGYLRSHGVGI